MTTKTDIEQLRAEFEAWYASRHETYDTTFIYYTPENRYQRPSVDESWAAYQAGRAALQSQPDAGWKEAFKAWNVCASIHREWAKGKDAVFTTRQADFVRNAENAFKRACGADATQSQDREDAVERLIEAVRNYMSFGCPVCSGDCFSANPPVSGCPTREAQEAIDHARRVEGDGE